MPESIRPGEMYLVPRVHVGEATTPEGPVEISHTMNYSPVVDLPDGASVYWTWEELIQEAQRLAKEGG